MSTCDLCWATFPDEDELAKHVQMEEAIDWPIPTKESDMEDHYTKMIDAALTTAWMKKCGPAGTPGKWFIPGELLEVLDLGDFGVDVYPIRCHLNDKGEPSVWSGHVMPGPNVVDAWDWRVNIGWDDLDDDDEGQQLEDLGGGVDERSTSFMVLGSHDERPPIPVGLAAAIVMLKAAYA